MCALAVTGASGLAFWLGLVWVRGRLVFGPWTRCGLGSGAWRWDGGHGYQFGPGGFGPDGFGPDGLSPDSLGPESGRGIAP